MGQALINDIFSTDLPQATLKLRIDYFVDLPDPQSRLGSAIFTQSA